MDHTRRMQRVAELVAALMADLRVEGIQGFQISVDAPVGGRPSARILGRIRDGDEARPSVVIERP